ncbi:Crp/Fnr family transcriptional regulator [Mucilaginibacter sp. SMC90]|uniref:Crp/Fnr family transcriptional regulator n=1 Tax=Mucilaginibacter sp. SMC90 TaxID=2929803 RepID=UPI001FB50DD9|nr:Crp/Fnr family transcriptional regulator [Mucilaginibacter sp. SMC90]UOE48841.1 Crp/Fnr family transcriptional regulator [Mucilaginibacter sp. SMC90]
MQAATRLFPTTILTGTNMRPVAGARMDSEQNEWDEAFRTLIQYVQSYTGVRLTTEETTLLSQTIRFKSLRRRQYLLQEGDICRYLTFVASGALKMYNLNDRGYEAIIAFSIEKSWMADRESMELQTASIYNIEAIEKTQIFQLTTGQLDTLSQTVPAIAEMVRLQNKQLAIDTQKRIRAAISMTAEERFHDLIACNPEYIQRFSQNMIASYLGIKAETLSRLRKR